MSLNTKIRKLLKVISYLFIIYFIYLLVLIALQYVPIKYDVAFLNIKQDEIKLTHYKIAFFSHVFSSIIVIIIGLPQFSYTLRKRFSFFHKLSGKIYISLILLIASPSGLIMAYYANGGIVSQISFILLSILWFTFTYKAYKYIKVGNWKKHKNFMLRSYALTLSAISLRLFKWGIVSVFELAPMDTYKIVSIIGWTLNLVLVEIYILKTTHN
ncbi:MAG TPA: DUF2306 domain-containing protein [Crocinitomix sp.]|nr:DUF2306 domain-containing protein [Crocinitomix sp.]